MPTVRPRLVAAATLLTVVALGGCFDVEEKIKLNKNLSGTAAITMQVDLEPLIYMTAAMQKQLGGQPGEPTAAELKAARTRILAEQIGQADAQLAEARASLDAKLPKGMRVTALDVGTKKTKLRYALGFSFEHLEQLAAIDLGGVDPDEAQGEPGAGAGEAEGEGEKNPLQKPFRDLKVQDDGKTLLIEAMAPNPAIGSQGQSVPPGSGGEMMQKGIEAQLKKMRVVFELTAPFKVLEHNATRVRGKSLVWEFDFATLDKLAKSGTMPGIRVRYAK